MRRLAILTVVVALAAFGFAGCDADGTPSAASVNGSSISNGTLTSTLSQIAGNKVSSCLFTGESLRGAATGTYAQSFAATVLTFMIERELVRGEVARLDLPETTLARSASAELLNVALASSSSSCVPTGTAVTAELPNSFRTLLSDYETYQSLLAAHLTGTALTANAVATFASAHPLATEVACVSQIIVSSKNTATALANAARRGTSFAALARANSLDTSTAKSGGALGCEAPIEFPSEYAGIIASTATGGVSDPIALESPYYGILYVSSRRPGTTLDNALGVITSGSAGLSSLLVQLASSSAVQVDPTYGSWSRSSSTGAWQVTSPSAPPSGDVTNLGALSPPAVPTSS